MARRATRAACDVDGSALRFVFGQQIRSSATARLILEIDVGQRVAVMIAHDTAAGSGERRASTDGRSLATGKRFLHCTEDEKVGLQVSLCRMRIKVLDNNIFHLLSGCTIITTERDDWSHCRKHTVNEPETQARV
jgi:hypothetical protein